MWVEGDKWSNCTKYNGIVVIWIYSNIQDMLTGEEHLFTFVKGNMISERKLTRPQKIYWIKPNIFIFTWHDDMTNKDEIVSDRIAAH